MSGQWFFAYKEENMSNYELQMKQVVDYPLCRIYR